MTDFERVVRGNVVRSDRIIEDGYVAISGGVVVTVGQGTPPSAREVDDARGCFVLPGAIDAQTHQGSQLGQEGFRAASRAAAAGGVTVMVDMPYDEPQIVNSAIEVKKKADLAEKESLIDVALYGTLATDDPVERVAELASAGVCAFKFSTFGTHPKRFPRIPPHLMHDFFTAIAPTGLAAGVHNEIDEVVVALLERERASGDKSPLSHGRSRPPYAETLAMTQIYELGASTGCRSHVVHCSVGRGYEICEGYRRQGYDVSVECCVHYLVLSEEEHVAKLGGFAKINPPVRPKAEVDSLWRHLEAGHIDMVSSDHVIWSRERKSDLDMLANASGIPGLETLMPLLFKGCIERGIDIRWVPRLLSEGPARHFRLLPVKGRIEPGYDADLVVLEPGNFKFNAAAAQTIVDWSPYDGMTMPVRVNTTYLRGKPIWAGGAIDESGRGRFVKPTTARS
jgi:allantoinase